MSHRPVRILLAVLVAVLVPVVLLMTMIVFFGPGTAAADQAFAERVGAGLVPMAGVLMTLLAAIWAARPQPATARMTGLMVGVFAAAIDATLLVLAGTSFDWLLVIADVGRVLAGIAGGAVAALRS
jgi:hypothetical protein